MGRLAAGSLTERVTLTNASAAIEDGQGGWLESESGPEWTRTVHAERKVLSGSEALRLGQVLGGEVALYTVRYTARATSDTRLTTKTGQTYSVRHVEHDTRREFSLLTCVDNGRN
ncbi:phage head closure protein [Hymenobacter mucosus]|uniref:Phage head-tail adaptor, putative, SPP1 family n=1 Tax=Hymenobacter mucosus TaxID=1411120 RepID=A0A239A9L9_9BACT|nr:phage head closure protein [Hymenobacter mucosus]SNR92335.1 phage head-tail adaptor, putative, SPP1 family [Hymenobacter mucosus]